MMAMALGLLEAPGSTPAQARGFNRRPVIARNRNTRLVQQILVLRLQADLAVQRSRRAVVIELVCPYGACGELSRVLLNYKGFCNP
jgi:hypothetical protein